MSFDSWSASRAEKQSAEEAARRDEIRRGQQAGDRVIERTRDDLLSVVPHLRTFPTTRVAFQRLEWEDPVALNVRSVGPNATAWEFPPTREREPRIWVDENGGMWHELNVSVTDESLPRSKESWASATAVVPFDSAMLGRQLEGGVHRSVSCVLLVSGREVPAGDRTAAAVGRPELRIAEGRGLFFTTEQDQTGSGIHPGHLAFDPDTYDVGFALGEDYPITVREHVFTRVRDALDTGARTL